MSSRSLTPVERLRLALRIWSCSLAVALGVRRRELPEVVRRLRRVPTGGRSYPATGLGRAVHRCLRPFGARCIIQSLVLYRLLHEQGEVPELVIGLPDRATGHAAHAWVEVAGAVVGPPPGRLAHVELARYA